MRKIECKSEIGVTIGLIDGIIALAQVLAPRLDIEDMRYGEIGDEYQPVRDSLTDLCCCVPLKDMLAVWDGKAMALIHTAATLLETRDKAGKNIWSEKMTPDQILDGLRNLCGYVENGSDTKVAIYQDDATKTWTVSVGMRKFKNYHGESMSQALIEAIEEECKDWPQ